MTSECTCYDDGVMCVLGDGCPAHDHRTSRLSGRRAPGDEIARAVTITIPGGVVLTDEEIGLRAQHTMNLERALIVARSILKKVETACSA